MELRHQIFLSGPPGVGKTTVGAELAARLHLSFFDLDRCVHEETGATPAELLSQHGEDEFRRMELAALKTLPRKPAIIALGGGTLLSESARTESRSRGLVVGLKAGLETLEARLAKDGTVRPLLAAEGAPIGRLSELLQTRTRSYGAVDRTVSGEGAPTDVANRVSELAGPTRIRRCRLGEHSSRVLMGRGLEDALLGSLSHQSPSRTVVVLADAGVPSSMRERYLGRIPGAFETWQHLLPGGETCKTWSMLEEVVEGALAAGAGRQSVVVGLGGGAVLDLAGLVASLLGRGARLVLVPTTVLAQADASIGGKCAINTRAGRNLAGHFHPAEDVLVDLDFLESLSAEEHRSGLVEILKMGLIADGALFRRVIRDQRAELDTLDRAIELKAAIVERDPFERGDRMLLNLGHTFGHALEAASGYQLRHGAAVAVGLSAIAAISRHTVGLSAAEEAEITGGMRSFWPSPPPSPELCKEALSHLRRDKKGDLQGVELILLPKIGGAARRRVSWSEVEGTWMPIGGSSE